MGLIAKLIEFSRTQRGQSFVSIVKGLPGARPKTSDFYSAPNEDAVPLPEDFYVLVPIPGSGQFVAVAYADVIEKKSAAGEKRIYARNASGVEVCEIHLKNEGSIRIQKLPAGASGYLELKTDGSVEVNGGTITADGDFITLEGVSLRLHTHTVISGAGAGGATGPALP